MAHEVETMAYLGATPWHGLGAQLSAPNMTLEETMQAAGLGWSNQAYKLYIQTEDGLYIDLETLNPDNTAYRAIIRDSDGYCHNILTDDYKIHQNEEIVNFIREFVAAGGMAIETLGALKHGSLIWVLAKMNKSFTLPGGDTNETYLLLYSSHDGTREFSGFFTSIRVVCANTLRMACRGKKGRSFSIRHEGNSLTPEVIAAAKLQIGLAMETTEVFYQTALQLVNRPVTTAETFRYVAELVQPALLKPAKIDAIADTGLLSQVIAETSVQVAIASGDFNRAGRELILSIMTGPGSELESAKGTAWGLVNGVSNYVDHTAGRSRDTALTSAWFGAGADLKTRAMDLAVKMANA